MPTINLAPNESSEPIAVTALKLLGIDTDKPVRIATAAGSVIARTSHRQALVVVPPTDSIVITAESEGAEVSYTTEDA